jgi:hypothetical protein
MNEATGKRLRLLVLAGLAVGALVLFLAVPRLPQDPAYHDFADRRTLLGLPHCLNVLSNLPFLAVGLLGLRFVLRPGAPFLDPTERRFYLVFFAGVGLTAFGSAYYHLAPDNGRLVWDRLPMTLAFTALFAAVVAERVSLRLGLWVLPSLAVAGLASVAYWHWSEGQGRGDLRPYYLIQFHPLLALPVLLALFPPRYSGTGYLLGALGWYVAAKVVEHPLDGPVYRLGQVVSGHTLKHLAAAVAAFWVLLMLWRRRPLLATRP